MEPVTFSREKTGAIIFSLGLHAIVLFAFIYWLGQRLPVVPLLQIQTISVLLPMEPERLPALPVKATPAKARRTIIHEEKGKPAEAVTPVAPAKETVPRDKTEEVSPTLLKKEEREKKEPEPLPLQAQGAGVPDSREKDSRVAETTNNSETHLWPSEHRIVQALVPLASGYPVVQAPARSSTQGGTGIAPALPAAASGLLAGPSAKGKAGEQDGLSPGVGTGKLAGSEKPSPGDAKTKVSGEGTTLRTAAETEAAPASSPVVAVPRYGENPLPAYPPLARRRGYAGVVMLSVEVLTDGTVGHLEVKKSSGYELLDRSALEAVKGWKFSPGKKAGLPVIMRVDVPVRFSLN